MYFVKPNYETFKEATFHIANSTDILIRAYSSYANVTEDDVIDTLVKNVVCDKDFIRWLRENKTDECSAPALTIIEKVLNEK